MGQWVKDPALSWLWHEFERPHATGAAKKQPTKIREKLILNVFFPPIPCTLSIQTYYGFMCKKKKERNELWSSHRGAEVNEPDWHP